MSNKKYEIIINEGSAPNKSIIFDCKNNCGEEMNTSEIITSAVASNVIQTKDIRWIESIKDITDKDL